MGILPLQFLPNETPESLGLTGKAVFEITGLAAVLAEGFPRGKELVVKSTRPEGSSVSIHRDSANRHATGAAVLQAWGILEYVLRQLSSQRAP